MNVRRSDILGQFVGPKVFASLGQHAGQPWLTISDGHVTLTVNFDDPDELETWLNEALDNLKSDKPERAVVLE